MSTLSARRKAMRGTKRTCLACEVRFYDLARSPIACPSCGAPYTPAPEQGVQARTPVASFSTKTGWRTQPLKRPQPTPVADPADSAGSESAPAGDDATDEAPEDDLVLEHEQDDADAPGLIDPESTESDEH